MKIKIILVIVISATIVACGFTKKKQAHATSSTSTTPIPVPASPTPLIFVKPSDGIYVPGNEELTAIQAKYNDVTLEKLKQGHSIYTEGACINCHRPQNIYEHGEPEWKNIIEDMAQRANISDTQKDAVYKYVLAIKARQPK